jgi:hypothetical protein
MRVKLHNILDFSRTVAVYANFHEILLGWIIYYFVVIWYYLKISESYMEFIILHSVRYNSIITIRMNDCTQFY